MFNRHNISDTRWKYRSSETLLERVVADKQERAEKRWNIFVDTLTVVAISALMYMSVSSNRLQNPEPKKVIPRNGKNADYFMAISLENRNYMQYIKEVNETRRMMDSSYFAFVENAWEQNINAFYDENPNNDTIYLIKDSIPCIKQATERYINMSAMLNANKEEARKFHEMRINQVEKYCSQQRKAQRKEKYAERIYARRERAMRITKGL